MRKVNRRTKTALLVGYLLAAGILAMGATVTTFAAGGRPIGVEMK